MVKLCSGFYAFWINDVTLFFDNNKHTQIYLANDFISLLLLLFLFIWIVLYSLYV